MPSVLKIKKSYDLSFHHTLRFKLAVSVALLLATLLIINAALLIYSRIGEFEAQIDQSAVSFAQLTPGAFIGAYERYSANEAFKFREEVASYLRDNRNVEKIALLDKQGQVLFDSADKSIDARFKAPGGTGAVASVETLNALRRIEFIKRNARNENGDKVIEIINPYIQNGNAKYFLRYIISLKSLEDQIYSSIIQTTTLTLLSIMLAFSLAMLFARRITGPIDVLTKGTSAIAKGDFAHKLDVNSNDELQDLARNFNYMAEQLKLYITKLEDSKAKLQDSNIKLERTNARLAQTNVRLERTNAQVAQTNLQLEESNAQLERANIELRELDRMKTEFLQTMSHELRTPLSAIKGYNEYLLEQIGGVLNSSQERAVRIIQRNVDRLAAYINALLDFSRMEAGSIPITILPFKLKPLIDQAALPYKEQIRKKSISFIVESDEDPPAIKGDRDRIIQVLDSLISNAVKFTPEGGMITVSIRRLLEQGRRLVEISVADTGIGISEKNIEKIFDRFYQVDSSTTRKYGGMGIGLPVAKAIIDAHRSTIRVESKENSGTKFSFVLEEAEMAAFDSDPRFSIIERKKSYLIELIDDEPDVNEVMKISLIKEGYNVIDAATGEEGIQIARNHKPDLIILDVRLPDANGFDVLKRLKDDDATRSIPVVIMSIIKDGEGGYKNGAIDHLTKPVDLKLLKMKINRYLQDASGTSGRPTVMIVDDETDVVQFLTDRLSSEGFDIVAAENGLIALKLLKEGIARPHLILLDVMMPELSGWEVMKELKSDPATLTIPVVMLTAKGAEEEIKKGYELGARDFIVKPFEIKDLLVEIRNIVQEQSQSGLFCSGAN